MNNQAGIESKRESILLFLIPLCSLTFASLDTLALSVKIGERRKEILLKISYYSSLSFAFTQRRKNDISRTYLSLGEGQMRKRGIEPSRKGGDHMNIPLVLGVLVAALLGWFLGGFLLTGIFGGWAGVAGAVALGLLAYFVLPNFLGQQTQSRPGGR